MKHIRGAHGRVDSPFSLAVAAALATLMACGGNGTGPDSPPAGGNGQPISGNERLQWDTPAADTAELSQIRYAIYIDTARSELTGVSCTPPAGPSGFACGARLPAMTPGQHTIELASFVVAGGTILESPKSPPLRVTVGRGALAGAISVPDGAPGEEPIPDRTIVTADGIQLNLHVARDQFNEATDIAIAPDGRLFITERRGQVRLIAVPERGPETALTLDDVDAGSATGGLLAIALSPTFDGDGLVYLLYTTPGLDGPAFRVARFREVNGRLAERAVLMDGIAASPVRPTGSLRFGADSKMYVGFDDGGNPESAEQAGSFNGKILRLNPDGTTPTDRSTTSPVYSIGHGSPRGFDWHMATGAMWVIDASPDRERVARAEPDARASPRQDAGLGTILPRHTGASAIAIYHGRRIPGMNGDLLVAAAEAGNLLRLRLDPRRSQQVSSTESLLPDDMGAVRAVTVGSDGTVYIVGTWLMTLTPVERASPRMTR